MKPVTAIQSKNFDLIKGEVKNTCPDVVVELIARQKDRSDEAAARIEKEGSVVRNLRGDVVPHPAIEVEKAATKLIADLMAKHKRPTPLQRKTISK